MSVSRWAGSLCMVILVLMAGGCQRTHDTSTTAAPARLVVVTSTASATTAASPAPSLLLTATSSATPRSATAIPSVAPSAAPTATPSPTTKATVRPAATPTPGPTPDGLARSLRVPVLMYHYVSEPPPGSDIYREDLSVSPDRFESHLAYLREAGYVSITLDDLLYALTQGRLLPEKAVILTFDDGYRDNYYNAFPLLKKYGMTGHFFIISDFVNQERPAYMTWAQIEEMSAAGQRIGSHSRDHPDLRNKPVDFLVWQALGGIEAIEEHVGYHPRWIAYPSGGYDAETMAVYASAHYWGGLTTQQGATHSSEELFELRRVRIRGSHTDQDLARLLSVDW